MKKYINPNIPRPTPGDSKSEATRYKTQPVKPDPTPKPKPKPKPSVKRRDVSNEQLAPRRVKPTPSRRRFLDELNEMNKRSR